MKFAQTPLLFCLLGLWLFSSCGADSAMKKGDKYLALGEYYDAATQYKKAYAATPAKQRDLRGQRALKMARCYARINQTQRAIAALNNAVRYHQADSSALLILGQMQLKNGSYRDAEKTFTLLLDSMPHNALVKAGLESAKQAPAWKAAADFSGYTVKRQDIFNSRRSEYSPALSGDDSDQLFFSSTRNTAQGDEYSGVTGIKNADIFWSQKDEKGKWLKPEAIESGLNSADDEGACAFTPDGKVMYLTICRTDPSYPRYAQIASSKRSDASWSKPTVEEITRDTLSTFAHPAVSPDGQWLYFVSDMPGGMGGYDIWRIMIAASGLVGLENLGAPINTAGDELFPTFRPNGDFYFSSNGHPGLGGLDIFIARPEERGGEVVYELEHPGYPLNSQGDDFGMTFEGLHNRGYFSSNRGDARGWDHIFSFEKHEIEQTVKGWVYERDGYELPQALVRMVGSDGTNLKLSVKGDGSFNETLKPGVDYVFLGTCKGFLNHKEELHVDTVSESKEYVLQFPLASITAPVLIDNIFYDFDRATLRPESTAALDELIVLLNENPNVTIELSAHTDYRGSSAYNKGLSQRRAESVVAYLTAHGIAADRLTAVGYGKEKPKVIKRKLTEKLPWLKEGDTLTEEFIKTLDEEKQEECNQLNRRTEFIVLRTTYGLFDAQGQLKEQPEKEKEEEVEEEDLF